jgi:hypothetical protein
MSKARYEIVSPMGENSAINAPYGIRLVLPSGASIELMYRRSDGEVSLSTDGRLIIRPFASNVVRVEVYR